MPRSTAHRPRRGRVASTLGVVTTMAVLSACGGGSGGDSDASVPQRELTDQLPAASVDVDSLTWNMSTGEPDTIDPRNAEGYSGGAIVRNLCEGILRVNPDFSIESNLGEVDQVSPTQLVITVRDGATFWDGNPVTAADVAYSLNRSSDPDSIVGYSFSNVSAITQTADDQVTVDFTAPDELFTKALAGLSGIVMEQAFTEAAGDTVGTPDGGLMCSGPFQLDQWRSGDSITVTRNDAYWNPERFARPGQVKFTFLTDSTAIAQALNAGEIDGAYELSPATISALENSDAGELYFGPSTGTLSLYVARPDGPLANPDLREALQTLVDRQAIADVIFEGAARPSYAVVDPSSWELDTEGTTQAPYDELTDQRTTNNQATSDLIQESGYDGESIVLAYLAGDEAQSRLAQLVQQQAESAGLTIELQPLQPLVFSQAGYDATAREGVDLLLAASYNAVADPLEQLTFTFDPTSPYNYTQVDLPQVNDLLSQIRASFDEQERADLFVQAQEIYEPENVQIPIVSTDTVSFVRTGLTGAVTSFAYLAMPSMAFVGADQ